MIINVWEFYVRPEAEKEFEEMNGPDGDWYQFLSQSPEFFGTNYLKGIEAILKDEQQARRYLTQDRWRSQEGFERYVRAHAKRFDELSEINLSLVVEKNHLGFFAPALD